MKVCLTVLIGLPGSGKTTFSQTLKSQFDYHDGKHYNFIHVCYDDLLPHEHFEQLQERENRWKELRGEVSNQIDLMLGCISSNNFENCPDYFKSQLEMVSGDSVIVVIIDDNMYLRSMRYSFFKKAKQYNASFCQVYLKCSLEQSVERNFSRTSKDVVPLHVITDMNNRIEAPKNEKWEKYSLVFEVFNNGTNLYSRYFKLLNESLDNPEFSENKNDNAVDRENSMLISMTNILHQSDITLRQIISAKIKQYLSESTVKGGCGKGLQNYSAHLSVLKAKVLGDIRSGAIQLPEHVQNEIKQYHVTEKRHLKSFLEKIMINS